MAQLSSIFLSLRVGVAVLVHALNRVNETEAQGLALDLLVREEGQVLGGLDIRDVLGGTLGEDDVDLFERTVGSLWIEEVDHGQEGGVDHSEEEVSSPTNSVNPVIVKSLISILSYFFSELVWTSHKTYIMGVTITIRKLNSQLLHVDTALALARVLIGLTSAGYNQGRGSHVAPKDAI